MPHPPAESSHAPAGAPPCCLGLPCCSVGSLTGLLNKTMDTSLETCRMGRRRPEEWCHSLRIPGSERWEPLSYPRCQVYGGLFSLYWIILTSHTEYLAPLWAQRAIYGGGHNSAIYGGLQGFVQNLAALAYGHMNSSAHPKTWCLFINTVFK